MWVGVERLSTVGQWPASPSAKHNPGSQPAVSQRAGSQTLSLVTTIPVTIGPNFLLPLSIQEGKYVPPRQ